MSVAKTGLAIAADISPVIRTFLIAVFPGISDTLFVDEAKTTLFPAEPTRHLLGK